MSAENLNRTSDVIESPAVIEIPRVNVTPKIVKNTRVNVDVLKQRIIEKKKLKELFFFQLYAFH
jgi:hypothetical protein